MNVHVPKPWNDKLAGGVNDPGIRWQVDVFASADAGNEIVRYQDGPVRKRSGARGVNDRDMGHRQDIRRSL